MSGQRSEEGVAYFWKSIGFPGGRFNHRSEITGTPAATVDRNVPWTTMTSFEPQIVNGGVDLEQLGWMLDGLVRKIETGELSEISLRRNGVDVARLQPARFAAVGQRIGIAKGWWPSFDPDHELEGKIDEEIIVDFEGGRPDSGKASR